MIDKKLIRKEMRSLMRCMDYALGRAEAEKVGSELYYEMYSMLGTHAWTTIARLCEAHIGHEYKVSKKYPGGRCILCGTVRRKK